MAEEASVITSAQEADPAITSEGQEEQKVKGINWEQRYLDSSEGARKVAEKAAALEAKLETLEKQRSLTDQERARQQQAFVHEEVFLKAYEDKGIPTEAGRLLYQQMKYNHDTQEFLKMQNQALANRVKFHEENSSRMALESNPDAKSAVEFCEKLGPVAAALPLPDKIEMHRKSKELLGVQVKGRDLTDVKKAAGAGGTPTGKSAATSYTAEQDSEAKSNGFPSAKAMEEYRNVSTLAENDAFWAKYGKK